MLQFCLYLAYILKLSLFYIMSQIVSLSYGTRNNLGIIFSDDFVKITEGKSK